MRVGLFIPCYIDQLYPHVGLATLEVLERFGCVVEFPPEQTCCGQPMANTGCTAEARPLAVRFFEIFRGYEYVVAPSGSCVAMVRLHYEEYLAGTPGFDELKAKTSELCEFLHDVVGVNGATGRFPHRVGLHQSCHGLRERLRWILAKLARERTFGHDPPARFARLAPIACNGGLPAMHQTGTACCV